MSLIGCGTNPLPLDQAFMLFFVGMIVANKLAWEISWIWALWATIKLFTLAFAGIMVLLVLGPVGLLIDVPVAIALAIRSLTDE